MMDIKPTIVKKEQKQILASPLNRLQVITAVKNERKRFYLVELIYCSIFFNSLGIRTCNCTKRRLSALVTLNL